ncbi:MmcQ/YjbR family DNA-binding protein [Virgisporangium aurantiacum]|uniref:YjbR protein n=1 Tax=Virgisporangium aurantiacum TaxID=175570 RepID=A0A8J3Z212_9ACTN|nr:hypothetical protein Vau01_026880 [Virgisporangium aurantiacum]
MPPVVTVEFVKAFCAGLPRTEVKIIRDRLKFRVGPIVYAAYSRDETQLGFGFPKEERAALVEAEPHKFFLPGPSDMRFRWVCCWPAAIEPDEMEELLLDAWAMCVPKKVRRTVVPRSSRPDW